MITTSQQIEYLEHKLDTVRLKMSNLTSDLSPELLHKEEMILESLIKTVRAGVKLEVVK